VIGLANGDLIGIAAKTLTTLAREAERLLRKCGACPDSGLRRHGAGLDELWAR